MAFNLPAAQYLNSTRFNDANRGTFGTALALGRKVNGNLPITLNAGQITANVADGTFGGVYLGLDAQDGNATEDVSSETKVLLSSFQFNAPNRIQVNTLANDGVVIRLASGAGNSPTNFKQYTIGGNDTPLASAQAGPVTICIDLKAPNENSAGGTFDETAISAWGAGITKGNIIGGGSALLFFQRVFIFTTTKGSSNIPNFTGAGSNFDEAFSLLQGTDYTDKIGSWITKSGSSFFIPCPIQFGDGTTSTQFDDQGVTVISPQNNGLGAENFRISEQAMRVYLNTRNNVADSVILSGAYVWGTAAPWDFDVSNDSSCELSGNFAGMGSVTLGSSVTASGNFNLASGSGVICNGANIDNINVVGPTTIKGDTVTSFSGLTIDEIKFDTAGTYTLTGCNVGNITNSSAGAVTINNVSSILSTTTPGAGAGQVNIVSLSNITFNNIVTGSDIVIKDPAITSDGNDNNIVERFSDVTSTVISWDYTSAPPIVEIEVFREGFKLFKFKNVTTGGAQSLRAEQVQDQSYI